MSKYKAIQVDKLTELMSYTEEQLSKAQNALGDVLTRSNEESRLNDCVSEATLKEIASRRGFLDSMATQYAALCGLVGEYKTPNTGETTISADCSCKCGDVRGYRNVGKRCGVCDSLVQVGDKSSPPVTLSKLSARLKELMIAQIERGGCNTKNGLQIHDDKDMRDCYFENLPNHITPEVVNDLVEYDVQFKKGLTTAFRDIVYSRAVSPDGTRSCDAMDYSGRFALPNSQYVEMDVLASNTEGMYNATVGVGVKLDDDYVNAYRDILKEVLS